MEEQNGSEEDIRYRSIQQAKRIEQECTKLTDLYTITSLRWAKGGFWQKNAVTILTALSAITTGSTFSQIIAHNTFGVYFSAVISFLVTLLIPILNLHKPEDRAVMHETAKRKYAALQTQALLFHTLYALDKNKSDEDLIAKLMELQSQKDDLDTSSVSLPDWVYKEKIWRMYRRMYQLERQDNQAQLLDPPSQS